MPAISLPTSFNIDVAFEVPGFGQRLLAWLIDVGVELCYLIVAFAILRRISNGMDHSDENDYHNLWAIQLLFMVPLFIYHIVMEITTNGQSLGKKLMHLRVVNDKGGRASISQFLIRWLLRVSDLWIVIILILLLNTLTGNATVEMIFAFIFGFSFLVTDIVLVATSKKSQRIGDLLAHTILIRTNIKEDLGNTVFREVNEGYIPMFPQVMRISDKDLNIIKHLLDNARKTGQYGNLQHPAEKVKAYLGIATNMENEVFLDKLLHDYNYLSTN